MFENLKNLLPESLREKLGLIHASDVIDKLDSAAESGSDEDSEEDKKKKRNSMIFRVIIILGIAAFVVDEFFLAPVVDKVEETVVAKPVKRKKAPALTEAPPVEEVPTEAPPVNDITTDAIPPAEVPPVEAPPVENIVITPKEDEVTAAVEKPAPMVEEKIDELAKSLEQDTPVMEEVKIPSQGQIPSLEPEVEAPKDNSMASKIVEVEVMTAPPSYDQLGRGLVYNCKDRHWACLDKPSYVTCNKNMKWNKSKGNPAECVVQDIYSSDEDCAKVQKYNVSTSLATPFCN